MKLRLVVLLNLCFISNYSQAADEPSTIKFEYVGSRAFNMMEEFVKNPETAQEAINMATFLIREGSRYPNIVNRANEVLSALKSGTPVPPLPCKVADQKEE